MLIQCLFSYSQILARALVLETCDRKTCFHRSTSSFFFFFLRWLLSTRRKGAMVLKFWMHAWFTKRKWSMVKSQSPDPPFISHYAKIQGEIGLFLTFSVFELQRGYCHTRPNLQFQLSWKTEKFQLVSWATEWHYSQPWSHPPDRPAMFDINFLSYPWTDLSQIFCAILIQLNKTNNFLPM